MLLFYLKQHTKENMSMVMSKHFVIDVNNVVSVFIFGMTSMSIMTIAIIFRTADNVEASSGRRLLIYVR